MPTPLQDIKYLANSVHRVDVLSRLAEASADRVTLLEDVDISPPTLSRVLNGFRERGWVRRLDTEYELSTTGKQLAAEFAQLVSNLERQQKLQQIEELVPISELDVNPELFEGAMVVTPTPSNPLRPVIRGLNQWSEADAVRGISVWAPPADNVFPWRRTVKEQDFEMIVTSEVVEIMQSDASMTAAIREILSSSNVEMSEYRGEFPCTVIVADDIVIISPYDEGGIPGTVESDIDDLREWAHALIDGYASDSAPLTSADFPESSA